MKKVFLILGGIVLLIVVFFLVAGLVMPKDIVISRTITINAPKNVVFNQMSNFKNWTHWSPWYKMDSTMQMTYSGTDGMPGSGYQWVGDEKKTGAGAMKCLAINATQMDFQVDFTKPDRGTAKGILKAEDATTAGTTQATWSFAMHMPYPFNAMCLFMNMDKMLGSDFEKGLNNMKSYAESHLN